MLDQCRRGIRGLVDKVRKKNAGLSEVVSLIFVKSFVIGLLLFMSVFVIFDQYNVRKNFEAETSSLMELTSRYIRNNVSDADIGALDNLLNSLKDYSSLRYIAVLNRDGYLLTELRRNWSGSLTLLDDLGLRYLDRVEYDGYTVIEYPVYRNGFYVGRLIGVFDQSAYYDRLQQVLSLGVFFFVLCLLIGILASKRKLNALIQPLRSLVTISEQVEQKRDFSLRMENSDITEFNSLSRNFNQNVGDPFSK